MELQLYATLRHGWLLEWLGVLCEDDLGIFANGTVFSFCLSLVFGTAILEVECRLSYHEIVYFLVSLFGLLSMPQN